jgi:F-type H+-transporting ATPase subunit delta
LDESPELLRLFTSPVISNLKKQSIIESLFKDKLSPLSMRFLTTLVRKNREVLIREIIFALEELYNIKNSIAIADVSSARAMSKDEQSQLVSALEKKTGFTIKAHWNVDEALIGGLKVQIKDRIYDGSVSYKIDRLTQAFSSPN